MRSLSNVFKDSDIIIENHCLILDGFEKSVKSDSHLKAPDLSLLARESEALLEARAKAHRIIEAAEENAGKIILEAANKAHQEYEQIKKEGYEAGLIEGREKAEHDFKTSLAEFRQIINSIENHKNEIFKKYEEDLINLSLKIAKKIIETELQKNSEAFLSIYKNAVGRLNEQEWLKITVSGFEADFAFYGKDILMSLAKGAKDIKVEILENAPLGTCIIETPLNIIDASVQSQLYKLEDAFIKVGFAE